MRRLLVVMAMGFCVRGYAQKAAPELKISTTQRVFHQGERIPLEMRFTGPNDGSLMLDVSSRDMGARLTTDDFHAAPAEGTVDPLAQYLAFEMSMFVGRGGTENLSSKAIVLHENLNEWIRFDRPGPYRVTVTSHRVRRSMETRPEPEKIDLTSNELAIEIVPATEEWQKAMLKRILSSLSVPLEEDSEATPQRREAIADLRYLASPGAIAVLASYVCEDSGDVSWDAVLGLVGVPPAMRETVVHVMRDRIADPVFPVSSWFLGTLAAMQMDDMPLPADLEDRHARSLEYKAKKRRILVGEWRLTASELLRKKEPARGVTARALADEMSAAITSAEAAPLAAVLRGSFASLTLEEKKYLLVDEWPLIGSKELLPELKTLARLSTPEPTLEQVGFGGVEEQRAIALRRWYEFEPEAAVAETRSQVGTLHPRLSGEDLSFLPPETFQDLEPLWARALTLSEDLLESDRIATLLIRFGTGAVVGDVAPLVTAAGGDCNRRIGALAYVVRFAPERARPILMRPSAHPGEQTVCPGAPLQPVSRLAQGPVLTESALEALKSPYPNVVQDGAFYLKYYGDKTALEPLLDVYLAWSKRWAGKEAPGNSEKERDAGEDYRLGEPLAMILLGSQGWIADQALQDTVSQHCVAKLLCGYVTSWNIRRLEVQASRDPYAGTQYGVGNLYGIPTLKLFEAKLDQYPVGTVFTLDHARLGFPGEQREIEASLPAVLEKHGMKLVEAGVPR